MKYGNISAPDLIVAWCNMSSHIQATKMREKKNMDLRIRDRESVGGKKKKID